MGSEMCIRDRGSESGGEAFLEQAILDASNGLLPPQGQADPDDALDGLAHMVIERRKKRVAALSQPGPASEGGPAHD